MKTRKHFWKKAVGIALAMTMACAGGVAFAAHTFNDVPNSNIFHDEIDFLAEREITLGCGGGNFCPKSGVTREQMAAFLERTARALSPVVLFDRESGGAEDVNSCIIGPYVPDFEQVAVFSGGIYAHGPGQVSARVQVRANGGSWSDVEGAWYTPDEPAANDFGNSQVSGHEPLNAGVSYEFSVDNQNLGDGTSTGCVLHAVIHHRMPGGAPFTADLGSPIPDEANP